jgi:hypothetical protein
VAIAAIKAMVAIKDISASAAIALIVSLYSVE